MKGARAYLSVLLFAATVWSTQWSTAGADEPAEATRVRIECAQTVALDQETGKMAVTLVNRDGAFVLFGACTVP